MGKRRSVARLLAGTCLLAGSAGVAHSEVRSLSLYNTHTQERASIVFKRDGSYDQSGLRELNRLLRDWRRNEVTRMDPQLFDLVWAVYRESGSHQPIHIVSGYRSPTTNNALRSRSRGVAKFSQHMLGKAMDFYLPDVNLEKLREIGMKQQAGGVGFYPTSGSPFVHMDTGSVRAWPRMTREQLVRLFPNGRTAHVPSDGTPLPGYQQALAEAESRKAHGGGSTTRSSSGGGLLAALFGGGSSSSSYSASSDEDEEGSVPASRRIQELRQGPLPSSKTVVAAASEAPPGVAGVPVYRSSPKQPAQPQVRLAEVDLPRPAPEREVPEQVAMATPTATAKGSLVGLPIPQPSPLHTAAAGRTIPSRYGPNGDGLPPGWVRGPSGRPVGEGPSFATQQLAALAEEPVHGTPIAVPLPPARPGSETARLAAAEPLHGTPFAVTLPRPRPTGMRVAGLEGAGDAAQAFSALTGERDEPTIALGYAPAAAPETTGFATASVPSTARSSLSQQSAAASSNRGPASFASRFAAPSSPTDEAVARAAARAGKADRVVAAAEHVPAGKSDRASDIKLYEVADAVSSDDFAQLRHPDQQSLDWLLDKPGVTLATGFGSSLDELRQRRFTGPAIVALAVFHTE
jgi:uncharacterized protein YcbK (DUF882 family)